MSPPIFIKYEINFSQRNITTKKIRCKEGNLVKDNREILSWYLKCDYPESPVDTEYELQK